MPDIKYSNSITWAANNDSFVDVIIQIMLSAFKLYINYILAIIQWYVYIIVLLYEVRCNNKYYLATRVNDNMHNPYLLLF